MATAPTDDPLGNDDCTVGVCGEQDLGDLKSLKRDALLFDQIAIPNLDRNVADLRYDLDRDSLDELFWLRDIGIVRDGPLPYFSVKDSPTVDLQFLNALAETPLPIMASDHQQLGWRLNTTVYYAAALSSRMCSTILRHKGINAFPILRTRGQIATEFPSGTDTVLEVVLKSMPIPDDQTPWQDIIEFRDDPDSTRRLRGLRV